MKFVCIRSDSEPQKLLEVGEDPATSIMNTYFKNKNFWVRTELFCDPCALSPEIFQKYPDLIRTDSPPSYGKIFPCLQTLHSINPSATIIFINIVADGKFVMKAPIQILKSEFDRIFLLNIGSKLQQLDIKFNDYKLRFGGEEIKENMDFEQFIKYVETENKQLDVICTLTDETLQIIKEREHLLNQLNTEEVQFVIDLQKIIEVWKPEVNRLNLFTSQEPFQQIEQMLSIHTRFSQDLKEYSSAGFSSEIGLLIAYYAGLFNQSLDFLIKTNDYIETIEDKLDIDDLNDDPEQSIKPALNKLTQICNGNSLTDYLNKPRIHFVNFQNTLSSLHQITFECHADKSGLGSALDILEKFVSKFGKREKADENSSDIDQELENETKDDEEVSDEYIQRLSAENSKDLQLSFDEFSHEPNLFDKRKFQGQFRINLQLNKPEENKNNNEINKITKTNESDENKQLNDLVNILNHNKDRNEHDLVNDLVSIANSNMDEDQKSKWLDEYYKNKDLNDIAERDTDDLFKGINDLPVSQRQNRNYDFRSPSSARVYHKYHIEMDDQRGNLSPTNSNNSPNQSDELFDPVTAALVDSITNDINNEQVNKKTKQRLEYTSPDFRHEFKKETSSYQNNADDYGKRYTVYNRSEKTTRPFNYSKFFSGDKVNYLYRQFFGDQNAKAFNTQDQNEKQPVYLSLRNTKMLSPKKGENQPNSRPLSSPRRTQLRSDPNAPLFSYLSLEEKNKKIEEYKNKFNSNSNVTITHLSSVHHTSPSPIKQAEGSKRKLNYSPTTITKKNKEDSPPARKLTGLNLSPRRSPRESSNSSPRTSENSHPFVSPVKSLPKQDDIFISSDEEINSGEILTKSIQSLASQVLNDNDAVPDSSDNEGLEILQDNEVSDVEIQHFSLE